MARYESNGVCELLKTYHGAEAQGEEHEEEEHGPQGCDGHLGQGLWVHHEHQAWTCNRRRGTWQGVYQNLS